MFWNLIGRDLTVVSIVSKGEYLYLITDSYTLVPTILANF